MFNILLIIPTSNKEWQTEQGIPYDQDQEGLTTKLGVGRQRRQGRGVLLLHRRQGRRGATVTAAWVGRSGRLGKVSEAVPCGGQRHLYVLPVVD